MGFTLTWRMTNLVTMHLNQTAPTQHSHPRRPSELSSSCKIWGNPYLYIIRPARRQLGIELNRRDVDNQPGARTPDNVGIASTILRSALEVLMNLSLVSGTVLLIVADSCCTLRHLRTQFVRRKKNIEREYLLLILLFALNGVLQPIHVTVFTANFMSPPTVGVAIWMLLVCPPDTIIDDHTS